MRDGNELDEFVDDKDVGLVIDYEVVNFVFEEEDVLYDDEEVDLV